MAKLLFNGESYPSKSVYANAQRTINFYPETDPSGKNKIIMYPTPGLVQEVEVGIGPIRGMLKYSDSSGNNVLYVVSGFEVYSIAENLSTALIGTMTTGTGAVSMAHNGKNAPGQEFIIVDGTDGYTYDINTLGFTAIADGDFPDGCTHVTFFNGLFLVNDLAGTSGQTGAFMWSASYDGTTWAALDFATAERNPDDLLAIKAINKTIYLLGEQTIELWFATNSFTKPFQPQTTIGVGIKAPHSAQVTQDKLIWLGTDEFGMARLYVMVGAQFQPVSNSALEQEWDSFSTTSDAVAFIYEQDGHTFYELTFPSGDMTYIFDVLENKWHERSSYNGGAGGKHLINYSAYFNGKVLVGDSSDGKVYSYDSSVYLDGTDPIVRTRTTQHINTQEDEWLRHIKVKLEFQQGTGVALTSSTTTSTLADHLVDSGAGFVAAGVVAGTHRVYNTTDDTESEIVNVTATDLELADDIMVSGDAYVVGIDPQVGLSWSDDGGNTFKGPIYRNIGLAGNYIKQVVFHNLGRSKDRVYKIECSDNANYTLIQSWAEGMVGDHNQ